MNDVEVIYYECLVQLKLKGNIKSWGESNDDITDAAQITFAMVTMVRQYRVPRQCPPPRAPKTGTDTVAQFPDQCQQHRDAGGVT